MVSLVLVDGSLPSIYNVNGGREGTSNEGRVEKKKEGVYRT